MPIQPKAHREAHRLHAVGWLRAGVLGANDGLISTASLVVGVAAASVDRGPIVIAATAGLVAGALSMAAGEYVSVSSQADTESADMARERAELETMPVHELEELTGIYEKRGLARPLAEEVAKALTAHDALGAHARDELGLHPGAEARPIQAALASAVAFAVGAAPPVALAMLMPLSSISVAVAVSTLAFLVGLGALAAQLGGAPILRGAGRVAFWGAVAMGVTALVGKLFGTTVA